MASGFFVACNICHSLRFNFVIVFIILPFISIQVDEKYKNIDCLYLIEEKQEI